MEDITGRFIEFYDYLYRNDLVKSDAQLAKIIDVTPSAISNILSGASKAQLKIVYGIAKGFTTVNIDWLLTGRGEMLKNETPPKPESNEGVKNNEGIKMEDIMSILTDLSDGQKEIKDKLKEVQKEMASNLNTKPGENETVASSDSSNAKEDDDAEAINEKLRLEFSALGLRNPVAKKEEGKKN